MDLLTLIDWPLFLVFVVGAGLGIAAGWLLRTWRDAESTPTSTRVVEPSSAVHASASIPIAHATPSHATPLRVSQRARTWPTIAEPIANAEASPFAHPVSGEWDAEAEGDGPQVLLVDDRLEMLGVHATYLRRHGYRILLAENGKTAVAFARAYHPAMIVLDYSMPDRTGVEVARELKADRETADIPILLMTAHSYGAVGASALAAGCAGFLTKPVEPSRLLREIVARTPKH